MQKRDQQPRSGVAPGIASDFSVHDLVAQLEVLADRNRVSLLEIVQSWGSHSFVPILLVLALMVVSPLSGIPMFSSFCGTIIAFVSLQMLWKRDVVWLPGFVGRRTVPGKRLRAALGFMRRVADVFDRVTRADRLHRLVDRPGRIVPQALCALCGVLMPLLEIVPFSSSVLGAAVLCFALSLLTRDGLLTVVGIAILSLVVLLPSLALAAATDVAVVWTACCGRQA